MMSLLMIYLLIGIITFVIVMAFLSAMIFIDSRNKDDIHGLWICTIPLVSLYCGMLWIFVLIDFIVFLIVNRKEL